MFPCTQYTDRLVNITIQVDTEKCCKSSTSIYNNIKQSKQEFKYSEHFPLLLFLFLFYYKKNEGGGVSYYEGMKKMYFFSSIKEC